jgi:hypothetical protein
MTQQAPTKTVWGEKAIQDELTRILGFRPSISWIRRRSKKDLPLRTMEGSNMRYAVVAALEEWWTNHRPL